MRASYEALAVTLRVADYSALCSNESLVGNGDVACSTCLASEHTPLAHLCAACKSYLCRHHGVFAHLHIVGYLYEIVQLDALVYYGTSHCRAVNAGVSANLNVVLDGNDTYLRYLVVSVLVRCEPESVGADNTSCMYCDTVA